MNELERRLRDLNTPSHGSENIPETAQPGLQNNNATAALQRQDFTDDQMRTIQQLVKDTVQQSSREFVSEAAKATVNAVQASSGDRLPLSQRSASPLSCTESDTCTAGVSFASPFQDIPAQYVKEIQSGEFFYLSKLLPKNLALHDDEDNLVLSLENSVVKVL